MSSFRVVKEHPYIESYMKNTSIAPLKKKSTIRAGKEGLNQERDILFLS
jgi:hypothetical protein